MTHSSHRTLFRDRIDAAERLAERLQAYRGQRPLVLAIPRGAVPMAKALAQALQGDLDVVLVRKLRAPFDPEFAIGSIDESGWTYLSPHAESAGAGQDYIAQEKRRQLDTIRQRRALYTPIRPPLDPAGRIAIVVDDGLATGATMMAALHSLRQRRPARLICAVPVSSPEALAKVRPLADEVLCLQAPADFWGVGQFYRDFAQVEDDEVIALLQR
ncbi:MAG: phosphoribosyltransferase [Proteobacteria bacterium]|nr:phosphoribosyltransferase [Pseudomonadota bacterium]